MNPNPDVTNIDPEIPTNAVSLYGQDDAMDDFPVLKAFQQYIDSEQAKARKRMVLLCAFFSVLMVIVISVFVVLLFTISSRNQSLNDRLIDFAMKERNAQQSGSAVVVQPPTDNSAILQLTEKLNEMQKRLTDSQAKAAQAEAMVREANKPKVPTAEELEIKRLKALLSEEKEQRALEKERQRQAEIEAYRRKHYPELYESPVRSRKYQQKRQIEIERTDEEAEAEIEAILKDSDAISYFDEEEDDEKDPVQAKKRKAPPSSTKSTPSPKAEKENYSIPVDIKGSSSNWEIPLE